MRNAKQTTSVKLSQTQNVEIIHTEYTGRAYDKPAKGKRENSDNPSKVHKEKINKKQHTFGQL